MKLEPIGKWLSVAVLALGLILLTISAKDQKITGNSAQTEVSRESSGETEKTLASGTEPPSAETAGEQEQETFLEEPQTEEGSFQTETVSQKPEQEETETESETEEPVYFRENREISQYSKVIMVGDSRFVGMESAVSFPGCEWICDVSKGLDWLENTAAPQIDAAITENCAIVFNMGVNDISRAGEYAAFLNSKVDGWTSSGADVYFMTVNPVDRSLYSGTVTNSDIVNFNNIMSDNLSPWFGYIDTYNDLTTNGYTSRDGLHYTNETYVEIFQYCMNQLHVVIS